MAHQNISAELSVENQQAVKAAISSIRQKMPFLCPLTDAERRGLYKLGPARLSFVSKALEAAKKNPAALPPSFDVVEFEKDKNLAGPLLEIRNLLLELLSDVDDTAMEVASEATLAAAKVHCYLKAAAVSSSGLQPLVEQLDRDNLRTYKC